MIRVYQNNLTRLSVKRHVKLGIEIETYIDWYSSKRGRVALNRGIGALNLGLTVFFALPDRSPCKTARHVKSCVSGDLSRVGGAFTLAHGQLSDVQDVQSWPPVAERSPGQDVRRPWEA